MTLDNNWKQYGEQKETFSNITLCSFPWRTTGVDCWRVKGHFLPTTVYLVLLMNINKCVDDFACQIVNYNEQKGNLIGVVAMDKVELIKGTYEVLYRCLKNDDSP